MGGRSVDFLQAWPGDRRVKLGSNENPPALWSEQELNPRPPPTTPPLSGESNNLEAARRVYFILPIFQGRSNDTLLAEYCFSVYFYDTSSILIKRLLIFWLHPSISPALPDPYKYAFKVLRSKKQKNSIFVFVTVPKATSTLMSSTPLWWLMRKICVITVQLLNEFVKTDNVNILSSCHQVKDVLA